MRILGLIENMSYHLCSHCGKKEEIFGHGGVKEAAQKLNLPFLGEIPLDTQIRLQADRGIPIVLSHPDSTAGQAYAQAVKQLAAQVSIASYETPAPLQIIKESV